MLLKWNGTKRKRQRARCWWGTYLQNERVFHSGGGGGDDFQSSIVSNLRLMFNYGAVKPRCHLRISMHNSSLMGRLDPNDHFHSKTSPHTLSVPPPHVGSSRGFPQRTGISFFSSRSVFGHPPTSQLRGKNLSC